LPFSGSFAKHIRMSLIEKLPPRSALYLPASNARAIEKARGLDADMIILDLEDAVRAGMKDEARTAAVSGARVGFGDRITAIRINGVGTAAHAADIIAVRASACDVVVLPKVEDCEDCDRLAEALRKPVMAMIETPKGVLNAAAISCGEDVVGLIAGTNDLANELHIPARGGRSGLSLALQTIVLAARAAGVWVFDGVYNDLTDLEGLKAECAEGRQFGFDGKTLIHPNQIEIANEAWSPSEAELADAKALIEAGASGAERFRDRMIEPMHIEMAERLLARMPHM
jgi:(3S)-malyl-CoA thioesterase